MAKKTNLDNFDNFDDFEREFGDFDFDDNSLPPPKNKREAITRTLGDVGKGFRDSYIDDKPAAFKRLLKAAMPREIRGEINEVESFVSDIKDEISSATDEVKKAGHGLLKGIEGILPEGAVKSKLTSLREKFSLDDNPAYAQKSKEQLQTEEIANNITTALGEMMEQQKANELVRQSVEGKRSATTNSLLQSIYAETKFQRIFHVETTNRFYRKSLELQYRSLFVQKETFALQKEAFSRFQQQFEAIVRNTGLPDVIKANNRELFKTDFKKKFRDEMITSLYKRLNPFEKIKKNVTRKIKDFKDGVLSSLEMGNSMTEMAQSLEGMGVSKAYMTGQMMSDQITDFIMSPVRKRIKNSKVGRDIVYNVKDFGMDPTDYLKRHGKKFKNKGGKINKAVGSLLNFGGEFLGSSGPTRDTTSYSSYGADSAALFDGRTRDSVVKIIPNYLSKILTELHGIRKHMDPNAPDINNKNDDDLVWNNSSETIMKKSELLGSVHKRTMEHIQKRVAPDITRLLEILNKAGMRIKGKLANEFATALIKFAGSYRTSSSYTLTANVFINKRFLEMCSPKLAKIIQQRFPHLLENMKRDYFVQEDISYCLRNIQDNLPNAGNYFKDLAESGHGDILTSVGVATRDENGGLRENVAGVDHFLYDGLNIKMKNKEATVSSSGYSAYAPPSSTATRNIYKRAKQNERATAYDNIKARHDSQASEAEEIRTAIDTVDTTTASSVVMSNNTDIREVMNPAIPEDIREEMARTHAEIVKLYQRVKREARKAMRDDESSNEIEQVLLTYERKINEYTRLIQNDQMTPARSRRMLIWFKEKTSRVLNYFRNPNEASAEVLNEMTRRDEGLFPTENKVQFIFRKLRELDSRVPGASIKAAAALPGRVKTATKKVKDTATKLRNLLRNPLAGYWGPDAIEITKDQAEKEFYNSEAYRSDNPPSYPEWLQLMHYKVKGINPSRVNMFFSKTREYDKKIATAMLKYMPKGFKGLWSGTKLGATGVKAGLGLVGRFYLDAMPAVVGDSVKRILGLDKEKKENEEKKPRAGSWLSRLNIFNNNKKEDGKKGLLGSIKDGIKSNPMLTIAMLVGGASFILKKMGLTMEDVGKGINATLSAIGSIAKGIGWVVGKISGIVQWITGKVDGFLSFFGAKKKKTDENGNEVTDENGNPVYENTDGPMGMVGKAVDTAGTIAKWYGVGLGLRMYGALGKIPLIGKLIPGTSIASFLGKGLTGMGKLAGRTAIEAGRLFGTFIKWLTGHGGGMIANMISRKKDSVIKILTRAIDGWAEVKSTGSKIVKAVKSPKVIKRVGAKQAAKVGLKIATMIGAGATGIGMILSIGLGIWELGWILKYWLVDDMSLPGAMCKQLLGLDLSDPADQKLLDEASEESEQTETEKNEDKEKKENEKDAKKNNSGGGYFLGSYYGDGTTSEPPGANNNVSRVNYDTSKYDTSAYDDYDNTSGSQNVSTDDVKVITTAGKKEDVNIILHRQTSMGGKPADFHGLHPVMQERVKAMAIDYKQMYGKDLEINSANRTLEQQIKIWEQKARVKYTGNKEADFAASEAAGGNPREAAYPATSKSNHLRGLAVDINFPSHINEKTRDPKLDPMLESHGLQRSETLFKKANHGNPERWHVEPIEAFRGGKFEYPQEPSTLKGPEAKRYKDMVKMPSNTNNQKSLRDTLNNNNSTTSLPVQQVSMNNVAPQKQPNAMSNFNMAPADFSNQTEVKGVDNSLSSGISAVAEILKKQLQVQLDIKSLLANGLTVRPDTNMEQQPAMAPATENTQEGMRQLNLRSEEIPQPAVNLKRMYI